MIFVSPCVYITNQSKQDIKMDLSLFLEKIENLNQYGTTTIIFDGIKCVLGLPLEIYFSNIDELLISTIQQIEIQDSKIEFQLLNQEEKNLIMNKLPGSLINELIKNIKNINKQFERILFIEHNSIFDINELQIDIASNQLFSFIKSIYTQDLKSFFEMMYHYNNKVIHDASLFMELTPIDTQILLNFYKEEIKIQNDELKKSRQ